VVGKEIAAKKYVVRLSAEERAQLAGLIRLNALAPARFRR
jgi:hypothetical protein